MLGSALHQIDVFNRDRAAIAVVHYEHGKTDRRFRRGHCEYQQREHLADNVAQEGRERHQVDVDREQVTLRWASIPFRAPGGDERE